MKIAIIGSKGIPASYGGTQVVVEKLAESLVLLGCEVTVYSRFYYSSIKKKSFTYRGFKVINIKGIKSKRLDTVSHVFLSAVGSVFSSYDIVVFHQWVPALFAVIPKLFGKRTIFHSHGINLIGDPDLNKFSKFDQHLALFLLKITRWSIDSISTVSISEIDKIKQVYRVKEVKYIPNGMDFIPVTEQSEKDPRKYLLTVGRLVHGKGIEYLIQAFNKISDKNPDLQLLIVGDPVFSDDYYNMLLKLAGQNKKIHFLGAIYGDALIQLYKNAFLVVIPSEVESFSLVAFESLFYNGGILCSKIPQFEIVFKGFASFFNSKDSDSLKLKIEELIENPETLERKRELAKSFPFKDFSWMKIARQYFDYYNQIIFDSKKSK